MAQRIYPNERWKSVDLKLSFHTENRLEVSNYGRLKTFNSHGEGRIIKPSYINGYPRVRIAYMKYRTAKAKHELKALKDQCTYVIGRINHAKATKESRKTDNATLAILKESIKTRQQQDYESRKEYFQALIHSLVAEYFLPKPKPNQKFVIHLDYDKENNFVHNLKFVDQEERTEHHQRSPRVIGVRELTERGQSHQPGVKLNRTKVALIKKLYKLDKTVAFLAKTFKVSESAIRKVVRGHSWKNVQAAA